MASDDNDEYANCVGRVGLDTRPPPFVRVQLTASAAATNGEDEIYVRTKFFAALPADASRFLHLPHPSAMTNPDIAKWFKDIDSFHGHRITSSSFLRHVVVVPPSPWRRRRRHGSAARKHHEAIVIAGTMSDELDDFWTGTNLDAVLAKYGEAPADEAPADEAPADEPAAKRQRSQLGE